jgi:tetratricopeptide (TPR) repeat protein
MDGVLELSPALARYEHALERMQIDPDELLAVLLTRDDVAIALSNGATLSAEQAHNLTMFDKSLRRTPGAALHGLPAWRQSVGPAENAWWWYLDLPAGHEPSHNLLWHILAGVLITITLPVAVDIIERLWHGAPDTWSVVGTMLIVLLTGGPLTRRGRDIGSNLLRHIFGVSPYRQAELMARLAALTFVIVLLIRFAGIPILARVYNNWGTVALDMQNLTEAQQHFQRSTALNPDPVVPYLNLGDAYADMGLYEEAMSLYQQALEHNANFRLVYARLGYQYNQQSEYTTAQRVLLAGLARDPVAEDEALVTQTEYELLSNLGWAYVAQEEYTQAREALEAAVALEPQLAALERAARDAGQPVQYKQALPHYYLAQVYEALGEIERARCAWQETLRYVDEERWEDRAWHQQATQRLQELGQCTP